MSVNTIGSSDLENKSIGLPSMLLPLLPDTWVRPVNWLALPSIVAEDQKFLGLHAVYTEYNFLALTAEGNYTVDWGDGTTANYSSGVVAYKTYDFATVALDGTNAPVTLTDTGDVVTRTAHGYTDGMLVRFYNIVSTTGLTDAYTYFVINATANTFQVSLTSGGSAVALTTDGTATLLPYKQAIVTVTPQAGQNLTTLNLHQKYSQLGVVTGLNAYTSGFLDIAVAGSLMTSLLIGVATAGASAQTIHFNDLQQANILSTGITSAGYLFYYCTSLKSVSVPTATVTNFSGMFYFCHSLQTIPPLDTAIGTDFSNMFGYCYDIQTVPPLDTANGTNFSGMFNTCRMLLTIPPLNTANGTNFANMFQNCSSIERIPLLDTANGTSFYAMFSSCTSLQTVPILDTANGTDFGNMFFGCYTIQTAPPLNTANGTNFDSMFSSCFNLERIPPLDTANGTIFSSMFGNCNNLLTTPPLDTANGTNFSYMYATNRKLQTIPPLNTANGTNFASMFSTCHSLQTIPLLDTANGTNFSQMFSSCYNLRTVPQLNTANGTNFTNMFSYCSSILTIPLLDTANGTSFSSMFRDTNLQSIPLLNTVKGTSFSSMFQNCTALENIPLLNTAAGTTFGNMFTGCASLQTGATSGPKRGISYTSCKLSPLALESIIENLGTAYSTNQPLTISANWGVSSPYQPISLTGTTTTGSYTITMANTSGITVGMQVTGIGTPSTTARSMVTSGANNNFTLTAHGLLNGDKVSFATKVTTTGIDINTIYFVINAAANTFQVSLTSGGAAIILTNNGSVTVRYTATVTAISTNVNVTLDRKATSTSTSVKVYRDLKTNIALLKGWAVTG